MKTLLLIIIFFLFSCSPLYISPHGAIIIERTINETEGITEWVLSDKHFLRDTIIYESLDSVMSTEYIIVQKYKFL